MNGNRFWLGRFLLLGCFVFAHFIGVAQIIPEFTLADTLRGMLRPERTGYDINFYDLKVKVDPASQWLSGQNRIEYTVVHSIDRIQVDLFPNLAILKIEDEKGRKLKYERIEGAVFIELKSRQYGGDRHAVTVVYEGQPRAAVNPPWDGGVSWGKDKQGKDWIVVTCQGLGASVWWPNKDHRSDEPDSMRISITVPNPLMNVSNGRLRSVTPAGKDWHTYEWFVHHPINNYSVTMNIGAYAHFREWYHRSKTDSLSLDYYVLPENLGKAKSQFKQVPSMLACFEHHFGPYPFPEDGFKVVEAPHPGMEHQSAIAYGNQFRNGYLGKSHSEEGKWFDFILVHESAHEWYGNSVTARDVADMWIHESFGTYMEAVYVECMYGPEAASRYMQGLRRTVLLDRPVVGVYDVNFQGSRDMYPKGALMLHSLRYAIEDDALWWDVLKRMTLFYRHQTTDYEGITEFMSRLLSRDLSRVFEQYLKKVAIPELEIKWVKQGRSFVLNYRWVADVEGFDLPVTIGVDGEQVRLKPLTYWQALPLKTGKKPKITGNPNVYMKINYQN